MKTQPKTRCATTVAATIAGEDVRCGDYVAVLSLVYELPSYLWDRCGCNTLPPEELVRLRLLPTDAGEPLKVYSICLPFLYVRSVSGEKKTLDLRRTQIARLNRSAAKRVWCALKPGAKVGLAD